MPASVRRAWKSTSSQAVVGAVVGGPFRPLDIVAPNSPALPLKLSGSAKGPPSFASMGVMVALALTIRASAGMLRQRRTRSPSKRSIPSKVSRNFILTLGYLRFNDEQLRLSKAASL